MKEIPIDIDNFRELINENYYYADKTKIIEDLLKEKEEVTVFTRPKRFGKTLLISMLENFFEVTKKEENKDLFKGLYIDSTKHKDIQNTYPVINISLKSLNQKDFVSLVEHYETIISKLYEEKKYLFDTLSKCKKKIYNSFLNKTADVLSFQGAISFLSICLYNYHK